MTALNPVLYQLYMIPSFRKGIMSLPEAEFTDKLNSLPYQLKKVFEHYDSEDKLPDLKSFCYALKNFEGKPTDPFTKIDAIEFLHTFFDNLDNSLKSLGKDQIINEPFRGKILHEILPKDCPHISNRSEDFYTIPLTVRHKKDLENSLAQFVQGEVLDDSHQFYCDQCQKKVDAIKRDCLSEIPNHLCFALKRFELDFETFEIVLLKDYFKIPNIIDLKPFPHEGLSDKPEEEKSSSAQNYRYRCSGAVIYTGSSPTAGCYYSLVKDREDGETWYKMGLKGKEKFYPQNFPEEAFGGEEEDSTNSKGFAYMVFYDKIESHQHHVYEREP